MKIEKIIRILIITFLMLQVCFAFSQVPAPSIDNWKLDLTITTKSQSIAVAGTNIVQPVSQNTSFDRLSENIELFVGTGKVNCLDYSPDGKYLAVGTSIGVDIFSSGPEWKLIRRFITRGGANSIGFSNNTLITGSTDGSVTLWDINTGAPTLLGSHNKAVTAVSITPDGKMAVSGSADKTVKLWNISSKSSETVITHDSVVTSVDISFDGKMVASGSYDNKVKLYRGNKMSTAMEHENWVKVVRFSPDGKYLASGGCDNKVMLMTLINDQVSINGIHNGWVNDLAFTSDSKFVLTAGGDNTAYAWEHQKEEHAIVNIGEFYDSIESITVSPDKNYIVLGIGQQTIEIVTVNSKSSNSLDYLNGPIYSMGISADGKKAACGLENGIIRLNDLDTGNTVKSIEAHKGFIYQVTYSQDGKFFASCSSEGDVAVFDTTTGNKVKDMNEHGSAVYSVAFMGDGTLVASGSKDRVIIWDYVADKVMQDITGLQGYIISLSYGANNSLAVGTSTGNIYLVDKDTKVTPKLITNMNRSVNGLSYNSDKNLIVYGTTGGDIGLIDTLSNKVTKFQPNDSKINCVTFNKNGDMVLSGDDEGQIKLWSVSDPGAKPYLVNIHGGSISSLYITSNNIYAISSGYDGVIRKVNLTKKSGFAPEAAAPVAITVPTPTPTPEVPKVQTRPRLAASVTMNFKVNSFPVVDENKLYICKTNGVVYALDKKDLKTLWSFDTSTIFETSSKIESTPAVDANNIYVSTNDGSLFALNKNTGKPVWSKRDMVTVVLNQAIIESGNFIYLAGTNKQLIKVKKANGEKVWTYTAESGLYTTPILQNNMIFFGGDDSHTYAVSDDTGAMVWRVDTGGRIVSTQAVYHNGVVVIANSKGKISGFDAQNGSAKWPAFSTSELHVRMIKVGENCYISNKQGEVVCINILTGKLLWSQALPNASFPQLITDGQYIYATGSPTTLIALDPKDGKTVWQYEGGNVSDLESISDNDAVYTVIRDNGKILKLWKVIEIPVENAAPADGGM